MAKPENPFDTVLADLDEWDRRCREQHAKFMRETGEALKAFEEVMK